MGTTELSNADVLGEFASAIEAAGLPAPPQIIADNQLHRFPTSDSGRDDAGWYVLDDMPPRPSGVFGCWRSGVQGQWRLNRPGLAPADIREARKRREEAKRKHEAETAEAQADAARRAADLWAASIPATTDNRYLAAKGVGVYGVRAYRDLLVVPMRDSGGKLWSLQLIGPTSKRFLGGGRVKGCYHAVGKPSGMLYIAEGYATAASVHEATGAAVAVAFSAGNLLSVAEALRAKLPGALIIIAADNDESGVGQEAARETASIVEDCEVRVPPEAGDWNDHVQRHGLEATREALK